MLRKKIKTNNYSENNTFIRNAYFKIVPLIIILFSIVFFNKSFAQVTITAPSLTITTCTFPSAPFGLGDIVITENAAGDISSFGTIILSAPANFKFSSGAGTFGFAVGMDIDSITATSVTDTAITFTINGSTFTNIDTITISGIQITGITGATGSANVTRTAGTSVISGDTIGTAHATLTSVLNSITGGTITPSQTVCSGGDPATLSFSSASTGSGTLTYQWQTGTDGTTFPNNVGTSIATYNPPSGLLVTTYYRCVTTSTLNGVACTANSNSISVTVNSVTGGTITPAQTVCSGGTPATLSFSSASTGSGTLSYQWQKGTDGTTFPNNVGTGLITYNPPSGLLVTTYYRCVTTSTLNGVACATNSDSISVTVNSVTAGTVASAQTLCSGGDPAAFTESVPATGSGALTYEWKQSTDSYSLALASTTTYDVPSGLTATTTYRRIATSTLGGVACSANSDVIVTIDSPIGNNTISASQTICTGTAPNVLTGSTPSGGNGVITYLWESSTTSSINGFATALGTSNNIGYTPGILTTTTWYRRTVTSGPCPDNISIVIQITVNPVISANTISAAQTICSGAIPAILSGSIPSGGDGSYVYLWESSTSNGTSGFTTASGTSNSSGYSPGALTTTTWYRRTATSGSCTDISTAVQITVDPGIVANTIASVQTICSGTTPSVLTGSTPTGGNGTFSYLWEFSTTSSTLGFTTASGTNNASGYTPSVLTANTWYRRTVTSGTCTDVSAAIALTVNPIPLVTVSNSSQTICSGNVFTTMVLNTSNSVTSTSYAWTRNNGTLSSGSVTGIAASGSGDITGLTLTNTTTAPVTVTFTIIPTGPAPTLCLGASTTATIIVNPTPTLSSNLSPLAICSGTIFSYTPTSTTSGATFIWTRATVTGISNLAGNGIENINETLNSTSASPINVTYIYNVAANGCTNATNYTIVAVVNPIPALSSSLLPSVLCSGTVFNYSPASATAGATFLWTRAAVPGISNSAANGTDDLTETLTNITPNPVIVSYIYTVTANNCTNTSPDTITVKVNPLPQDPGFTPYSTTVCSGSQNISFTLDSMLNNVSFNWTATNATLASSWGGNPNAVFNFGTLSPAIITLQAINPLTGCSNAHSDTIIVSGDQAPVTPQISIINDNWLVCQLNGAGITYQWGYDSLPTLASYSIPGAVFQQYHALDYPQNNKEYWVIVKNGNCSTKSYLNELFLNINTSLNEQWFDLFPNPVESSLNIICSENIIAVQLFDISGRLTIEKQIQNPQKKLSVDVKEMKNGIYLVRLETAEHRKFYKKLIIQH